MENKIQTHYFVAHDRDTGGARILFERLSGGHSTAEEAKAALETVRALVPDAHVAQSTRFF